MEIFKTVSQSFFLPTYGMSTSSVKSWNAQSEDISVMKLTGFDCECLFEVVLMSLQVVLNNDLIQTHSRFGPPSPSARL